MSTLRDTFRGTTPMTPTLRSFDQTDRRHIQCTNARHIAARSHTDTTMIDVEEVRMHMRMRGARPRTTMLAGGN